MTAPGPLGEEALRLVEAAREWAVRTFPEVDAHVATGSPECCWCPLCRAVAVLRGGRPEVTERLAEAVTAAAGALAAVLDAAGRPAPTSPAETSASEPTSASAPTRRAGPPRDSGSAAPARLGDHDGLRGEHQPDARPARHVELIPVDED